MKTLLPTLLLLLALPTLSLSQNSRHKNRIPPTKGKGASISTELENNISITLSGSIIEGTIIDLTLTGCSREFETNVPVGQKKIGDQEMLIMSNIRYTVSRRGEDYIVFYTISATVPVSGSSKNGNGATNIQFRDSGLSGTIKCTLGKATNILKSGNYALALMVNEP